MSVVRRPATRAVTRARGKAPRAQHERNCRKAGASDADGAGACDDGASAVELSLADELSAQQRGRQRRADEARRDEVDANRRQLDREVLHERGQAAVNAR